MKTKRIPRPWSYQQLLLFIPFLCTETVSLRTHASIVHPCCTVPLYLPATFASPGYLNHHGRGFEQQRMSNVRESQNQGSYLLKYLPLEWGNPVHPDDVINEDKNLRMGQVD